MFYVTNVLMVCGISLTKVPIVFISIYQRRSESKICTHPSSALISLGYILYWMFCSFWVLSIVACSG
jgi:hypothetical protein